jgi:tRNA A37 methylthiotransferase MiaB
LSMPANAVIASKIRLAARMVTDVTDSLTRSILQCSTRGMASAPPITNNPDVRFLGRVLGDVIRAYGGEALFRRIEYIRSASVDRHRGIAGADSIDPGLDSLSLDETLDFVRAIGFAGGHVFTYSSRPGTPAARMKNHLPGDIKKARSAQLRALFNELAETYRTQFIGETLPVLWESTTELDEWGWQMEGLTGNYLRVSAHAPSPRWNMVDRVRLTALTPDGLRGEIVA